MVCSVLSDRPRGVLISSAFRPPQLPLNRSLSWRQASLQPLTEWRHVRTSTLRLFPRDAPFRQRWRTIRGGVTSAQPRSYLFLLGAFWPVLSLDRSCLRDVRTFPFPPGRSFRGLQSSNQ